MIRRPRCGLVDYELNRFPRPHLLGNRRRRRYVLQGQKWAKTYLTYKYVNRKERIYFLKMIQLVKRVIVTNVKSIGFNRENDEEFEKRHGHFFRKICCDVN